MDSPRLLVTLCTYNERENLEHLLPEILEHVPYGHVLVVDDGSPDGTGTYADEFAASDERVRVLHRSEKRGLGRAMLAAFSYAVENGYERLVNLDADLSHPPASIPNLVAAADDVEVAIGSRYVPGGGIRGWGWLRHFMSRGVNLYTRWLLWLKPRDCSGSFRCYRVAKLAEIDFSLMRSTGYAVLEELLWRCKRVGCRFTEVPYVFEERRYGDSKINWREVVLALWVIFRLSIDNVLGTRVAKSTS